MTGGGWRGERQPRAEHDSCWKSRGNLELVEEVQYSVRMNAGSTGTMASVRKRYGR
jgi:hypothetical protein